MRAEKQYLIDEVNGHLKKSDYVILANFSKVTVADTAELRWVPTQQLTSVRTSGFDRWLAVLRDSARTWTDPQYVAAPTTQ